jgi:septation ring formation regulator EzrA
MTMEAIAEILEQELEEAVEVKNRKSLHRYITLLTQNYLQKDSFREVQERFDHNWKEVKSDVRIIADRMEAMQKQMDERFAAVDRRFDDVNKRFDDVNKRFDDFNKKFSFMFGFMSLGFIVISLLVTVVPKLL